jgi:hypothetical protein
MSDDEVYCSMPVASLFDVACALTLGLHYAKQCLSDHDEIRGRRSYLDRRLADTMEKDMRAINHAFELLPAYVRQELHAQQKEGAK